MPTYEYRCSKCGSQVEYERSFGEDHEPVCCENTMNRIWSATPTIFKTGGFYSTRD